MDEWNLFLSQLNTTPVETKMTNKEKTTKRVLSLVVEGCRTTKALMEQTGLSSSAISTHLNILASLGSVKLIRNVRNGPMHIKVLRSY